MVIGAMVIGFPDVAVIEAGNREDDTDVQIGEGVQRPNQCP